MPRTRKNIEGAEGEKMSRRIKSLPGSDIDLADMAQRVAKSWAANPIPLRWVKPEDFIKLTEEFAKQVNDRRSEGTTRPQITLQLRELDKTIDTNLSFIKNYISEDVGKGAEVNYYPQFGIEKIGTTYKLPSDRNKRMAALQTLLEGIRERNYTDRTYGLAFWQPIVKEYAEQIDIASHKDSTISSKVSVKNETKQGVLRILNALIYLLKANYPDSYLSELRKWGFQKEKY